MCSVFRQMSQVTLKCIFPFLSPRPCWVLSHESMYPCLKRARQLNIRFESTKEGSRYTVRDGKKGTQQHFRHRDSQPYPRSVFTAGTASRTAELLKRKSGELVENEPGRVIKDSYTNIPNHPLTAAEWAELKRASPHPHQFEVQMMKRMLAVDSDINIAKSLLAYVAVETGTLNYELLLKYLTLCVRGNHYSEVFDLYEIMKSRFKTLDSGACSLLIKVFSAMEHWREAVFLLETLSKTITPSPRNYGDVIAGALRHSDGATAWTLYDELLKKGLSPNQDTWQALFESDTPGRGQEERLQAVLLYMRDSQLYPGEALVCTIKAWFEGLSGTKWRANWSTAEQSGLCHSCGRQLDSIRLSEEEYEVLKSHVMEDVILGHDVFAKTTPQELERFRNFVETMPPFDVVLDGLNVANTLGKGRQSQMLLAVVSELEKEGLNILVLGRTHMQRHTKSWNRHHMTLVQQKAHCFFTDDISADDPFLLYATLHSGNHCNFVSRDLMRDHKACLPDSTTRRLFFKWQRGHQLVLHSLPGKRVHFQSIQSYDTIVQTDGVSWHIPYDPDGVERCSYEVPTTWLCVKREE